MNGGTLTSRLPLALLWLALAACGSAAPPAAPPAAPQIGNVTAEPGSPRIAANALKFDRSELALPANRPFALVFDNQEALPHNVSLAKPDGTPVFVGTVFTGPAKQVYAVPALAPATYLFRCDLHPDMKGTATAQ